MASGRDVGVIWVEAALMPEAMVLARGVERYTAAWILMRAAAWWRVPRVGLLEVGRARARLIVELGLWRWLRAWLMIGRTCADATEFRRTSAPVGVELEVDVRCRRLPWLSVEV